MKGRMGGWMYVEEMGMGMGLLRARLMRRADNFFDFFRIVCLHRVAFSSWRRGNLSYIASREVILARQYVTKL